MKARVEKADLFDWEVVHLSWKRWLWAVEVANGGLSNMLNVFLMFLDVHNG